MKLSLAAVLVALLLSACGGSQQPAPATTQVVVPDAPYCPPVRDQLGPWSHELFPDCPAWPIRLRYHVCASGTCPVPCGETTVAENGGTKLDVSVTYVFDDRRRYVGWMMEGSQRETCTYAGERLAACEMGGEVSTVERDPNGRILAVTVGDTRTPIVYDAQGWISALGERTLRYDTEHRLIGIGDTVIHLDSQGRVTSERGTTETQLFEYDERGRVVHTETKPQSIAPLPDATPSGPAPTEQRTLHQRIRYDGDKVTMISWDWAADPGGTTRYQYDCSK